MRLEGKTLDVKRVDVWKHGFVSAGVSLPVSRA